MRRSSFRSIAGFLALLTAALAPCQGAAEKPGSFRELVSRRVSVGAVTGGQAFAVAVRGTSIVAGPYALKVPGGTGSLVLTLEDPVLVGGRLASPVRLKNGTGLPLAGLRLDVTGVSVVETADPSGPSRDLGVSPPSPLWFGDLGPGEESSAVLLEVDVPVPEGARGPVVVMGVVTGAAVVADPEERAEADRILKSQRATKSDCDVKTLSSVRGEGFGQAAGPTLCRIGPSGIWVIDASGDPLKLFDSRARFLRTLGASAGANAAEIAFGAEGIVYLFEAGERPRSTLFLRSLRPF